jgi:hypothetical protein
MVGIVKAVMLVVFLGIVALGEIFFRKVIRGLYRFMVMPIVKEVFNV